MADGGAHPHQRPPPPECQLMLASQAAPAVIRLVGDAKSGRVSRASVDAFLTARRLAFDRAALAAMFAEADFKREGSLAPRELLAAVGGRYPKRARTREWRRLFEVLLGVEGLRLLDVDREPVSEAELAVRRKRAVFAYSAWADVEDMPPFRRSGGSSPGHGGGGAQQQSATASGDAALLPPTCEPGTEWRSVLARAEAAQAGWCSGSGSSGGGIVGSGACVRTCRGVLEAGGPAGSARLEADINALVLGSGTGGGQLPRCGFDAAERFRAHAEGLALAPQLRAEAAPFREWLEGCGGSTGSSGAGANATRPIPSDPAAARLAARLPRAAVSLCAPSALAALRASVAAPGGAAARRPPFRAHFHPLLPGDEHRLECLGLQLDLRGPSIARAV